MNLSGIKEADLVLCDVRGYEFYAKVKQVGRGRLEVRPLVHNVTYSTVTARQVIAHYRRSRSSRR